MPLTQQQLEARKNYIGSSEAKIIAEADVYGWQKLIDEKKGISTPFFAKDVRFKMDAGHHMEDFVIDKFIDQSEVEVAGRQVEFDRDYLHATVDAVTPNGTVIEVKTHWGFMTIDELANLYAPQLQHHMYCTQTASCYLVVFYGVRCRLEWCRINIDSDWLQSYVKRADQFWQWYTNDIMPEDMEFMVPPVFTDMFVANVSELEWDEQTHAIINLGGQQIIEGKKAADEASAAKAIIKDMMPDKCKQLDYDMTGNWEGHRLRITRSKSNTLTLRHVPPKEIENA